jgi:antitoxin VapB
MLLPDNPWIMALNIKNPDVERLAAEIADLTGESKTEAIRRALLERRAHLRLRVTPARRKARVHRFLEREVWARVPEAMRGRAPTKAEREDILGYGGEGA